MLYVFHSILAATHSRFFYIVLASPERYFSVDSAPKYLSVDAKNHVIMAVGEYKTHSTVLCVVLSLLSKPIGNKMWIWI